MFHVMFTCYLLTDCITLVCTVFNNIVVTNCIGGTNHGSKGNKRWRKPKGRSRMDLITLVTGLVKYNTDEGLVTETLVTGLIK
jgi:hypothetical protein